MLFVIKYWTAVFGNLLFCIGLPGPLGSGQGFFCHSISLFAFVISISKCNTKTQTKAFKVALEAPLTIKNMIGAKFQYLPYGTTILEVQTGLKSTRIRQKCSEMRQQTHPTKNDVFRSWFLAFCVDFWREAPPKRVPWGWWN